MKIGIITHYYNSTNYGGNLQAYALCSFLNQQGYDAEQIAYDKTGDVLFPNKNRKKALQGARSGMKKFLNRWRNREIWPDLQRRNRALREFNRQIPHSRVCYNCGNIADTNKEYDAFITGSDQIWHPIAVCPAYLLDFVSAEKPRISYAASLAVDTLNEQVLRRYQRSLAGFRAISVREESAKKLLQPISPVPVEWVLDPTLLLDRQEWETICRSGIVEGSYLFCFFLGADSKMRKTAEEFAAERGLQIVTMPHLCGRFCACDKGFGHKQLYDVTPGALLSLIRDASCVFTDSFHATVFSLIFQKEFFVFQRSGHPGMASRIHSLTALFDAGDHFCETDEKMCQSYIGHVTPLRYDRAFPAFEEMKRESAEFIRNSLENHKL